MAPSLDLVVTSVATQLMAADTKTAAELSQSILRDLVAVFDVDASFLRRNDHGTRVTKLVAEWPTRDNVPDPDQLGDVSFENADPVFAMLEHLKEPIVLRPDPITDEYGHRVERAKGIPVISMAVAPLLAQGVTTGALGFIKFDDREWSTEELNAVQAIASMFAQLHGRLIAEDRLRFLADHDDLTDLYNRRALMAHLDRRLADGEPDRVSVLLLDLDRLKTLNDYLGHVSGDQFIRVVAERLRDSQGHTSFVGRLGGDEFVVIPAEPVDSDDVEMLAERLRQEIQRGVTVGGEIIKRTVSIGVAFGTPGSDSASEVIQRADEALLVAKKSGGTGQSSSRRRCSRARAFAPTSSFTCNKALKTTPLRCTICPRSTFGPARSWPSKRWCDGCIPPGACWRQTPSLASPNPSTSPVNSVAGCCARRAPSGRSGARTASTRNSLSG